MNLVNNINNWPCWYCNKTEKQHSLDNEKDHDYVPQFADREGKPIGVKK